ncbi:type I restriction-modification system subunit M [Streptomyces klenkii]|uniref:type I restriction-modification system subunit M n=1 Tax=Streptomyces klenkii TaxID=1420899 RepID=UPI0034369CCB
MQPTAAADLLWKAVDTLRGAMDAAHYKSTVLTLLYLRCLSLELEQTRRRLDAEGLGDRDVHYSAEGLRWIPPVARWNILVQRVQDPDDDPVTALDEALDATRRSNHDLADLFPPASTLIADMERQRIAKLFTLFEDVPGPAVYEELLAEFARFEGKRGGEFYTPRNVVRLLVETLQPQRGRVYDPCCGSGGMLVQAARFVTERGGDPAADLAYYGQEVNTGSWQLARMNLEMQGLPVDLRCADTLESDLQPTLKADIVLATPPFNVSDWAHREGDSRWRYGIPPRTNANFAWLQHVVHRLSERGSAGVVLANGSTSSKQKGEGEIRKAMVEDDLVACIVALPAQLFWSTSIPACIWFLTKDKSTQGADGLTDRAGQTLFIDARAMGKMTGRARRELTSRELSEIARTYHAWRGTGRRGEEYQDVPGFCRSAGLDEIRQNQHILTPGRYIGATEDDRTQHDGQADRRIDGLIRELLELLDQSDQLTQDMQRHLGA